MQKVLLLEPEFTQRCCKCKSHFIKPSTLYKVSVFQYTPIYLIFMSFLQHQLHFLYLQIICLNVRFLLLQKKISYGKHYQQNQLRGGSSVWPCTFENTVSCY